YFKYISMMFENDRHFSHLSEIEREMSFRSEMALYYNYYKRLADRHDPIHGMAAKKTGADVVTAIYTVLNDNITEFPDTFNALKKFNIYPEVVIGLLYRVFVDIIHRLEINDPKECFVVERGDDMPAIESCEGIGHPIYFYIFTIFAINSLVAPILFLNSYIIGRYSLASAVFTLFMFFFNHGNCTRIQWTPPLRESFGYPIYLILHCYINYSFSIRFKTFNRLIVISLLVVLHISWQFSPFLQLSQLISLFLTFKCLQIRIKSIDSKHFLRLIECNFCSVIIAMTVTNKVVKYLPQIIVSKMKSINRVVMILINCLTISVLTLVSKVMISYLTDNRDDNHVWYILLSKLTSYRDFHTMLYTCSAEFDFMPLSDLKSITLTLLAPYAIIGTVVSIARHANEALIQFNAIQTLLFMTMSLLIMRLKLLFVPQLCIMSGLICRSSSRSSGLNYLNLFLYTLLISLSSFNGIHNIQTQLNIIGEYFNEPLEQLIDFTITSTHQTAVFAGTMPTTANLMLSTRRPIVNHPYYESPVIRNRTYIIYQLYSSHELRSVHSQLSSLSIDYIVLETNYCYSRTGKCRMNDIWKVEDRRQTGNSHRLVGKSGKKEEQEIEEDEGEGEDAVGDEQELPLICDQLFADPKPLFKRVFANNYYHVLQLIKH
ncbi:probable C-mannosyltransferase DPY19L1, partial [Oppia nitens]|uniref:probable C-mannosyltransferase DPY19L1 n=1 Tax=Oppia nitens TaxID=1686743 RepID=UPI0023DA2BEF